MTVNLQFPKGNAASDCAHFASELLRLGSNEVDIDCPDTETTMCVLRCAHFFQLPHDWALHGLLRVDVSPLLKSPIARLTQPADLYAHIENQMRARQYNRQPETMETVSG